MFGFLVILLFFLLTPGILFKMKGPRNTVAAINAIIFSVSIYVLSRITKENFQTAAELQSDLASGSLALSSANMRAGSLREKIAADDTALDAAVGRLAKTSGILRSAQMAFDNYVNSEEYKELDEKTLTPYKQRVTSHNDKIAGRICQAELVYAAIDAANTKKTELLYTQNYYTALRTQAIASESDASKKLKDAKAEINTSGYSKQIAISAATEALKNATKLREKRDTELMEATATVNDHNYYINLLQKIPDKYIADINRNLTRVTAPLQLLDQSLLRYNNLKNAVTAAENIRNIDRDSVAYLSGKINLSSGELQDITNELPTLQSFVEFTQYLFGLTVVTSVPGEDIIQSCPPGWADVQLGAGWVCRQPAKFSPFSNNSCPNKYTVTPANIAGTSVSKQCYFCPAETTLNTAGDSCEFSVIPCPPGNVLPVVNGKCSDTLSPIATNVSKLLELLTKAHKAVIDANNALTPLKNNYDTEFTKLTKAKASELAHNTLLAAQGMPNPSDVQVSLFTDAINRAVKARDDYEKELLGRYPEKMAGIQNGNYVTGADPVFDTARDHIRTLGGKITEARADHAKALKQRKDRADAITAATALVVAAIPYVPGAVAAAQEIVNNMDRLVKAAQKVVTDTTTQKTRAQKPYTIANNAYNGEKNRIDALFKEQNERIVRIKAAFDAPVVNLPKEVDTICPSETIKGSYCSQPATKTDTCPKGTYDSTIKKCTFPPVTCPPGSRFYTRTPMDKSPATCITSHTKEYTCTDGGTFSTVDGNPRCTTPYTCPTGFTLYNSSTCSSPPESQCPAGTTYESTLQLCIKPISCPEGSKGKYFAMGTYNTMRCVAEGGIGGCPHGSYYNETSKQCTVISPTTCPPGFSYSSNAVINACVAPVPCPPGFNVNVNPPYNTNENMICTIARPVACPTGSTYDTTLKLCTFVFSCPLNYSKAPIPAGSSGTINSTSCIMTPSNPRFICPVGTTFYSSGPEGCEYPPITCDEIGFTMVAMGTDYRCTNNPVVAWGCTVGTYDVTSNSCLSDACPSGYGLTTNPVTKKYTCLPDAPKPASTPTTTTTSTPPPPPPPPPPSTPTPPTTTGSRGITTARTLTPVCPAGSRLSIGGITNFGIKGAVCTRAIDPTIRPTSTTCPTGSTANSNNNGFCRTSSGRQVAGTLRCTTGRVQKDATGMAASGSVCATCSAGVPYTQVNVRDNKNKIIINYKCNIETPAPCPPRYSLAGGVCKLL